MGRWAAVVGVVAAALLQVGATSPGYDGRAIGDERDGKNWLSYGRT